MSTLTFGTNSREQEQLVATSLESADNKEEKVMTEKKGDRGGTSIMSLFDTYKKTYGERHNDKPMTLAEYLEEARANDKMYQSPHGAMVEAFGEPRLLETRKDERLGRIYENRVIQVFDTFEGKFFGMYDVIAQLYSFFVRAEQGLDERHKIPYLLGPVGGGKSSLAEHLKMLMEHIPFYALARRLENGPYRGGFELSPVFESPLGLFSEQDQRVLISEQLGVHDRFIPRLMSPWAVKRLQREFNGDASQFYVVKLYPSILDQQGIAVATPGDESNQDISTLVGKTDIRKVGEFSQNDSDCYMYSGALCRGARFVEFVEMFKAPIKTLNPLLPALTENFFSSTEGFTIPFNGIVMAHSNEAEWETFRMQKKNEAFVSRTSLIKVPYNTAVSDEIRIFEKLINGSALAGKPIAPGTLKALATFTTLTHLVDYENIYTKLRVYDGQNLKGVDTKAKSIHEYRDAAGVNEGMSGFDMRLAFEVLAKTYNHNPEEVAANPVDLLYVLENEIRQQEFGDKEKQYIGTFLKEIVVSKIVNKEISEAIQDAYFESADPFGQEMLDRYFVWAEHWLDEVEFVDQNTHTTLNREMLNQELEKIEKPAGIGNPKDFRDEFVRYVLKYRANNAGKNPPWKSYEKIRNVIKKNLFAKVDDLLPIISFSKKEDSGLQKKHDEFVSRMVARGYTAQQVRLLVDWHIRSKKSS